MQTLAIRPANSLLAALKGAGQAFLSVSDVFWAATAVSAAVENGRQPLVADMRRLGLEGVTLNIRR